MALNVDIGRAPVRPTEMLALVEAIRDATPADESHYLEWKSGLDWSKAGGGRGHAARAIIGFANRMPDVAARAFEGHAFFVVGAEPGTIPGTAFVDPVDLDQWITPYLGADGPRWRAQWVPVDGVHVLVIDVDPPQWGHPIFSAHKEGEKIVDGTVYVRGAGSTKPATGAQHKLLQDRLLRGQDRDGGLDIAVTVNAPDAVRPVNLDPLSWLAAERRRLLAPLRTSGMHMAAQRLTSLASVFEVKPEDRTEDEYREQVSRYLETCEERLPRVLALAASSVLTPLELRVENLSARNLPGLVLDLHIAGDVEAMHPDTRGYDEDDDLPAPPRTWGPRKHSLLGGYDRPYLLPGLDALHRAPLNPRPRPHIENGGSTDVQFPPIDLRPQRYAILEEVVLIVREAAGATLHATWSATSSATDGVAEGQFDINVSHQPWTVADWAEDEE